MIWYLRKLSKKEKKSKNWWKIYRKIDEKLYENKYKCV